MISNTLILAYIYVLVYMTMGYFTIKMIILLWKWNMENGLFLMFVSILKWLLRIDFVI